MSSIKHWRVYFSSFPFVLLSTPQMQACTHCKQTLLYSYFTPEYKNISRHTKCLVWFFCLHCFQSHQTTWQLAGAHTVFTSFKIKAAISFHRWFLFIYCFLNCDFWSRCLSLTEEFSDTFVIWSLEFSAFHCCLFVCLFLQHLESAMSKGLALIIFSAYELNDSWNLLKKLKLLKLKQKS